MSTEPKRMKSDQVRVDWKNVLLAVRAGGTVIVEHYKEAVARIIPADDTVVVLRASSVNEAERLRRLVRDHGSLGIPFPNNAALGWRVVDDQGKDVKPTSIPSVGVELA